MGQFELSVYNSAVAGVTLARGCRAKGPGFRDSSRAPGKADARE